MLCCSCSDSDIERLRAALHTELHTEELQTEEVLRLQSVLLACWCKTIFLNSHLV